MVEFFSNSVSHWANGVPGPIYINGIYTVYKYIWYMHILICIQYSSSISLLFSLIGFFFLFYIYFSPWPFLTPALTPSMGLNTGADPLQWVRVRGRRDWPSMAPIPPFPFEVGLKEGKIRRPTRLNITPTDNPLLKTRRRGKMTLCPAQAASRLIV